MRILAGILILTVFCGAVSSGAVASGEVLTWHDCVVESAKNNPDLISAVEAVNQKKAAKAVTASGLYPQVDSSVDFSRTGTTAASGATTTASTFSYGASASQLIFDGLKTPNNIRAASENIAASQQAYRFTSSGVRLNLRSAFVNLLKAQELIKVNEEIAKIRRDNLILITLRYHSGLEHKGALLSSEASLAEAHSGLSQAQRNLELNQRELTKALGRIECMPLFVQGDFSVREAAQEKPDFDELVKTNPSLLQAAAQKNAALFGARSAYGNFLPQLSGTAGTGKRGSLWPPQNEQWNVGASVSLPIFEGGLRIAQVSQAQAAYRQAVADERSARDSAVVSLEQTWAALQDALEAVDVQHKSLEAAEERSRIAQGQYSVGLISFDNWTIIEDALVNAKRSFLNAQANALLAEANWIQAKGETLEYE